MFGGSFEQRFVRLVIADQDELPFEFVSQGLLVEAIGPDSSTRLPSRILDPAQNFDPLYRFYNLANGAHFYTASAAERDSVMATWPHIYHYEGLAYAVSAEQSPTGMAVHRFYNVHNGTHFYTASPEERDTVIARWPTIYHYEGVAFHLNQ
jgi:hypothetical protein